MCSLSCELIIDVNCKQDFACGACMITDEAEMQIKGFAKNSCTTQDPAPFKDVPL